MTTVSSQEKAMRGAKPARPHAEIDRHRGAVEVEVLVLFKVVTRKGKAASLAKVLLLNQ